VLDLYIWRDFNTTWSEIDVKFDKVIYSLPGYKVYPSGNAKLPVAEGNGSPIQIKVSKAEILVMCITGLWTLALLI